MKAIILAAGVARRLYPLTCTIPKCLLEVGSKTILDRQLGALKSSGITDIIMVVGYYRESIIGHVRDNFPDINCEFVINHHYFETNTAYSLHLCSDLIKNQPFLLMNDDVLYPQELLNRVIEQAIRGSAPAQINVPRDFGRKSLILNYQQ